MSTTSPGDREKTWQQAAWMVCHTCNGPIEWVDCKDPYWRHIDASDLGRPHSARPIR
jgi:hypothetical protein